MNLLQRLRRRYWFLFGAKEPCPKCGSVSEHWHPESQACADCGYGVRIPIPASWGLDPGDAGHEE